MLSSQSRTIARTALRTLQRHFSTGASNNTGYATQVDISVSFDSGKAYGNSNNSTTTSSSASNDDCHTLRDEMLFGENDAASADESDEEDSEAICPRGPRSRMTTANEDGRSLLRGRYAVRWARDALVEYIRQEQMDPQTMTLAQWYQAAWTLQIPLDPSVCCRRVVGELTTAFLASCLCDDKACHDPTSPSNGYVRCKAGNWTREESIRVRRAIGELQLQQQRHQEHHSQQQQHHYQQHQQQQHQYLTHDWLEEIGNQELEIHYKDQQQQQQQESTDNTVNKIARATMSDGLKTESNGSEAKVLAPVVNGRETKLLSHMEWNTIASELQLRRTGMCCAGHVLGWKVPKSKNYAHNTLTSRPWTQEDREALGAAIETFGNQWYLIGMHLRRTAHECRMQWSRYCNTGRWKNDELERLKEAMALYEPSKISLIARYVGTRSASQCQSRMYSDNAHMIWDEKSSALLLEAVRIYGTDSWTQVISDLRVMHGIFCNKRSARNQYAALMRKEVKARSTSSSSSLSSVPAVAGKDLEGRRVHDSEHAKKIDEWQYGKNTTSTSSGDQRLANSSGIDVKEHIRRSDGSSSSSRGSRASRWSKDTESLLLKAVDFLGTSNWKDVAQLVLGNPDKHSHCRTYYQKHFDPRFHRGAWTDAEHQRLVDILALHSPRYDWSSVTSQLGTGRHPLAVAAYCYQKKMVSCGNDRSTCILRSRRSSK